MKKILFTLIASFAFSFSQAQIVCILCYDQNDSVSYNVNNLILNGSFENFGCGGTPYFCPNSVNYNCDITNWTCTGGGQNTYAHVIQGSLSDAADGISAAYMGNFYCNPCSNTPDDTSCVADTGCAMLGLPTGFPVEQTPGYGGATGVSLSQTVSGLTIGATYVLEFWAGGEGSFWPNKGMFGVDVGFGDTLLRNKQTSYGAGQIGTRFLIEFNAVATSHTIKFTNWGHMCGSCTELVLDDVKLYPITELNPNIPPCLGINPIAVFSAPNHFCPGTCTDFTNMSLNSLSYVWSFPGGTPSVSTDVNPTNICYNNSGSYSVSLIASNLTTSDTLTLNNYITVYPAPPAQGILQYGDTLVANQGSSAYQWYYNGTIIVGATDYYYVAPQSGNYSVIATDENSCEVEAVINNVIAGISAANYNNSGVRVYPNPANDQMFIDIGKLHSEKIVVSVYNLMGEKIHLDYVNDSPIRMDVSKLAKGSYWIEVSDGSQKVRSSFMVE